MVNLGPFIFLIFMLIFGRFLFFPLLFLFIGSYIALQIFKRRNPYFKNFKQEPIDPVEEEIVREADYEEVDESMDESMENTVMDADYGVEKPDENNPLEDIPQSVKDIDFSKKSFEVVEAEIIEDDEEEIGE